jgi:hypothetical protein
VSDFGDATDEDSFDPTAPADPEASARIILETFREVTGDPTRRRYDELDERERVMWVFGLARFFARVRREGGLR